MLDTFIGANDGVPIFIPEHGEPAKPAFLLTTMQEFPQKDIPDYIMAVENGDLKRPEQHRRRDGPAAARASRCPRRW